MKAMLATGMNALTVLWGQEGERTCHRQEGARIPALSRKPRKNGSSPFPHTISQKHEGRSIHFWRASFANPDSIARD